MSSNDATTPFLNERTQSGAVPPPFGGVNQGAQAGFSPMGGSAGFGAAPISNSGEPPAQPQFPSGTGSSGTPFPSLFPSSSSSPSSPFPSLSPSQFSPNGGGFSFDLATSPGAVLKPGDIKRAPIYMLFIGMLLSIAGVVLSVIFRESFGLGMLAWGIAALGVVAASIFLILDGKARGAARYIIRAMDSLLFKLAILVGIAAVITTSVLLGLSFGRL